MADVTCTGCGQTVTEDENDPALGSKLTTHIGACDTHEWQKPCKHTGPCWRTGDTPKDAGAS
ncbi:hypothetical protein [Microbacterium sp. UBA837]|uniref:hypothetical protein n=1 Tax=Microbacterium sp. UBA837 TaxID=1946956 RepID=UPI0025F210B3|nr:hypothetical protein [Microbacterium sp. UBA837]|tara:strand:+ start:1474 stop:1659 length:186 start_codon:yes stop_codon:yes gene_type:complete